MIPALSLILALAPAADAVELELAAELATVPTRDASLEAFDPSSLTPAAGLRLSLGLHERLDLTLAGHHSRYGARWSFDDAPTARAAYFGTDLALGVRGNLPVGDVFRFTGDAAATLLHGWARFDDDGSDRNSPVQISETGLAPGFRVGAGAEVHVAEWALPTTLVLFAGVGYDGSAPLRLGEVGDVHFRGLTGRAGLGLRF